MKKIILFLIVTMLTGVSVVDAAYQEQAGQVLVTPDAVNYNLYEGQTATVTNGELSQTQNADVDVRYKGEDVKSATFRMDQEQEVNTGMEGIAYSENNQYIDTDGSLINFAQYNEVQSVGDTYQKQSVFIKVMLTKNRMHQIIHLKQKVIA
jgi:hypothetical protein